MPDTGWKIAGAGANVARSGSEGSWGTTSEVTSDNGIGAVFGDNAISTNEYSDYLRASSFGLSSSIPSGATIDGIEVRWERRATNTSSYDLDNSGSNNGRIQLVDETGTLAGNHKGDPDDWTTGWVLRTAGGATDLWGWAATRAKVIDTNFGFVLSVRAVTSWSLQTRSAHVDAMWVRIYYSTTVNGSAVLSADASLTATARVRKFGQANLSADATLNTQGAARTFAQGVLSANATVVAQGAARLFAQSNLTADATLSAQGVARKFAQSALSADATLTAQGTAISGSPTANLSANATLSAQGIARTFAQSSLSANATLSATGIGKFVWGQSLLQATAFLAGSAFATPQFADATLLAEAELASYAIVRDFGNAALDATGVLVASAFATPQFGQAALFAEAFLVLRRDVYRWALDDSVVGEDTDIRKLYVQMARDGLPIAPTSGDFYERRILEIPTISRTQTSPLWGISGFGQTTLVVDNSDGLLNSVDVRGMYARITLERDSGLIEEFRGVVTGRRLSWQTEITIEDLDSRIFEETLPKRVVDSATFPNAADGLGKRIPIIFGRARKVPLIPINLNDTTREYDFLICEGNINTVYAVYREDAALDTVTGTASGATSTTLTLEAGDRRPLDNWYKWFWVEITGGTGSGQIRYVTAYNASTNQITVDTAWSTTPNTSSTYRLREWRLYDGSQSSPYAGLAFIRFKKRLGERSRFDAIYADVRGRTAEENVVTAIESILSNATWGLGLAIDSASFTAAKALSEITAMKCEGAILGETRVLDVLEELLAFRGMSLYRTGDGKIGITVDQAKTPLATFGIGDGAHENIVEFGGLEDTPLLDLPRNIRFSYEPDYKENGELKKVLVREANTLGNDIEIALPFVYSPSTADRIADYRRKRIKASSSILSITTGLDGEGIGRGDLVTIKIPSLGINGDFEVMEAKRSLAQYEFRLMPYLASTYTYEPSSGLPSDPGNIPTDFSLTAPDPVSNLTVTMGYSDGNSYADLTWTLPDENAVGAIVRYGLSGTSPTLFETAGQGTTSLRVNGLTPGVQYDFAVMSVSGFGLEGYPVMATNKLAAGDTTPPAQVTGLTASADRAGNIQYKWNDLKSSDPTIRHYELQIANNSSFSSGLETKIVDVNEFLYKAKLTDFTTSVTKYARCRAVDNAGNVGSYSSTVSATTGAIQQGDVINDEITGKASFRNDAAISLSAGTIVAQVTITARNQPIKVDLSCTIEDTTATQISTTISIRRGSTSGTIIGLGFVGVNPGTTNIRQQLSIVSIDNTPGSGSVTYYAVVEGTFTTAKALYRNMTAVEFRR